MGHIDKSERRRRNDINSARNYGFDKPKDYKKISNLRKEVIKKLNKDPEFRKKFSDSKKELEILEGKDRVAALFRVHEICNKHLKKKKCPKPDQSIIDQRVNELEMEKNQDVSEKIEKKRNTAKNTARLYGFSERKHHDKAERCRKEVIGQLKNDKEFRKKFSNPEEELEILEGKDKVKAFFRVHEICNKHLKKKKCPKPDQSIIDQRVSELEMEKNQDVSESISKKREAADNTAKGFGFPIRATHEKAEKCRKNLIQRIIQNKEFYNQLPDPEGTIKILSSKGKDKIQAYKHSHNIYKKYFPKEECPEPNQEIIDARVTKRPVKSTPEELAHRRTIDDNRARKAGYARIHTYNQVEARRREVCDNIRGNQEFRKKLRNPEEVLKKLEGKDKYEVFTYFHELCKEYPLKGRYNCPKPNFDLMAQRHREENTLAQSVSDKTRKKRKYNKDSAANNGFENLALYTKACKIRTRIIHRLENEQSFRQQFANPAEELAILKDKKNTAKSFKHLYELCKKYAPEERCPEPKDTVIEKRRQEKIDLYQSVGDKIKHDRNNKINSAHNHGFHSTKDHRKARDIRNLFVRKLRDDLDFRKQFQNPENEIKKITDKKNGYTYLYQLSEKIMPGSNCPKPDTDLIEMRLKERDSKAWEIKTRFSFPSRIAIKGVFENENEYRRFLKIRNTVIRKLLNDISFQQKFDDPKKEIENIYDNKTGCAYLYQLCKKHLPNLTCPKADQRRIDKKIQDLRNIEEKVKNRHKHRENYSAHFGFKSPKEHRRAYYIKNTIIKKIKYDAEFRKRFTDPEQEIKKLNDRKNGYIYLFQFCKKYFKETDCPTPDPELVEQAERRRARIELIKRRKEEISHYVRITQFFDNMQDYWRFINIRKLVKKKLESDTEFRSKFADPDKEIENICDNKTGHEYLYTFCRRAHLQIACPKPNSEPIIERIRQVKTVLKVISNEYGISFNNMHDFCTFYLENREDIKSLRSAKHGKPLLTNRQIIIVNNLILQRMVACALLIHDRVSDAEVKRLAEVVQSQFNKSISDRKELILFCVMNGFQILDHIPSTTQQDIDSTQQDIDSTQQDIDSTQQDVPASVFLPQMDIDDTEQDVPASVFLPQMDIDDTEQDVPASVFLPKMDINDTEQDVPASVFLPKMDIDGEDIFANDDEDLFSNCDKVLFDVYDEEFFSIENEETAKSSGSQNPLGQDDNQNIAEVHCDDSSSKEEEELDILSSSESYYYSSSSEDEEEEELDILSSSESYDQYYSSSSEDESISSKRRKIYTGLSSVKNTGQNTKQDQPSTSGQQGKHQSSSGKHSSIFKHKSKKKQDRDGEKQKSIATRKGLEEVFYGSGNDDSDSEYDSDYGREQARRRLRNGSYSASESETDYVSDISCYSDSDWEADEYIDEKKREINNKQENILQLRNQLSKVKEQLSEVGISSTKVRKLLQKKDELETQLESHKTEIHNCKQDIQNHKQEEVDKITPEEALTEVDEIICEDKRKKIRNILESSTKKDIKQDNKEGSRSHNESKKTKSSDKNWKKLLSPDALSRKPSTDSAYMSDVSGNSVKKNGYLKKRDKLSSKKNVSLDTTPILEELFETDPIICDTDNESQDMIFNPKKGITYRPKEKPELNIFGNPKNASARYYETRPMATLKVMVAEPFIDEQKRAIAEAIRDKESRPTTHTNNFLEHHNPNIFTGKGLFPEKDTPNIMQQYPAEHSYSKDQVDNMMSNMLQDAEKNIRPQKNNCPVIDNAERAIKKAESQLSDYSPDQDIAGTEKILDSFIDTHNNAFIGPEGHISKEASNYIQQQMSNIDLPDVPNHKLQDTVADNYGCSNRYKKNSCCLIVAICHVQRLK